MVDADPNPEVAGELPVTLSWKTRRKSGSKRGTDYGSIYTILPRGQIEELGWDIGKKLNARIVGSTLVLATSPPEVPRVRPRPESPYELDRIICGDVLEELAKIPSSTVHMIITSPPYNIGIEYSDYDDKRQYREYRYWLSHVWAECLRILKRGGRFALEVAPTGIAEFVPLHHDLARDIRAAGFVHRAEILWAKYNMTAPRTAWGSWTSPSHPHVIPSWEYVEVFHKDTWKLEGDRTAIDISPEDFRDWSDGVWEIAPDTKRFVGHPATFPEQLIRQLLQFYTYRGNTVLDPFAGTGTVAAVAKKIGRHFIHIDHSPKYCKAAELRVKRAFEEPMPPRRIKTFRPSQKTLPTFNV
ncbi:MAG TPA: site-specific DNA-methyltransferase [Thermoplasmata archaeon]|nr:site-specific DNA-methyltransferase [Thermoplasmata archaeon]